MARPKGTISQEILYKLLLLGSISIPSELHRFWSEVYQHLFKGTTIQKRAVKDAFYYLRKKRLIEGEAKDNHISIRLTPEGRKEVAKCQVDKMEIEPQKSWDRKWRLVILNFPEKERQKRGTIRSKLKALGFYHLQKGVWVFPYPCDREIDFLRDFFGSSIENIRVFEGGKLEEDSFLRKIFKLG
jgi:DNA-binding transcriptional regulator PaaX